MLSCWNIVLTVTAATAVTAARSEDLIFPEGFQFGVASAAYQVEGAWNVSDKGESIWDRFTHDHPQAIKDRSTADVACDSYHRWREDIDLVREVGADYYRFSISWPRLLPKGFAHYISEDGKRYYNDLIDGLLEKGIEPVLTLYHWDLPQNLQDLGGWANPLIAEWFGDYARTAYTLFGDRVKTWITINEAWVVCDVTYMTRIFPPLGIANVAGGYMCNKNVLMAHAHAWTIYDQEFRTRYHGKVSLANHLIWMDPENDEEEEIAELLRQYMIGRYSHPIYSKAGGWPPSVEKVLAANSEKEGYRRSILPAWTQKEKEFVRGTYDFYGVNFYSSRSVRRARPGEQLEPWPLGDAPEMGARVYFNPDWPYLMPYFAVHPEGIRKQLVWLKKQYGDIEIIITENGRPTVGGLNDTDRMDYYREYMRQVLLAIKEDGVNVTAYTAWTIMDNFEWVFGYRTKYGLYEVDFASPNRTRTARASAKFYSEVIRKHSLDVSYNYTISPRSNTTPDVKNTDSGYSTSILIGLVGVIAIAITVAVIVCKIRNVKRQGKKDCVNSVKIDQKTVHLRQ